MITPITSNQQSFKGINNSKKYLGMVGNGVSGLRVLVNKSNAYAAIRKERRSLISDKIHNFLAEKLVAPVMNSKFMNKLADKSVNVDNIGAHMATAGAFVTTAVYANRTLHKKELDKKRARTLALNQCLVTAVSTVGAYTVNSKLDKLSKKLGYRFREANQGSKKLNLRMQGFNIAKQLLIFTLMYRYIAPVIVTPIASKIGKLLDKPGKNNQPAAQNAVSFNGNSARDNFYKNLEMLKASSK